MTQYLRGGRRAAMFAPARHASVRRSRDAQLRMWPAATSKRSVKVARSTASTRRRGVPELACRPCLQKPCLQKTSAQGDSPVLILLCEFDPPFAPVRAQATHRPHVGCSPFTICAISPARCAHFSQFVQISSIVQNLSGGRLVLSVQKVLQPRGVYYLFRASAWPEIQACQ